MSTKVLLSAFVQDEPFAANIMRNRDMLDMIRDEIDTASDMPLEVVDGYWKGEREQAFMFTVGQLRQINALKRIAFDVFDQQAILIINGGGEGVLHYADGRIECAGEWTAIDADEIEACEVDCYTIVNGQAFACR